MGHQNNKFVRNWSDWVHSSCVVLLLSIWQNTTNICSRSTFKCISSLLGHCQGSCLGPLFFNFYSSKIFDIVGHHLLKVHCHADDSQLYLSINPSCAFSQDKAIRSMETCISDVKQWMTSDKLILNDDKTEFIVIASQHLLKKAAVKIIIIIIKYLYSAYTFQC